MWHLISIPLVGGVGNGNLYLPKTQILGRISIPAQAAISSGATEVVVSHLLGSGLAIGSAILSLTNVVTPYSEIPTDIPVSPANVDQTNYVYQMVQGINVSITSGVGANVAEVWILLSD